MTQTERKAQADMGDIPIRLDMIKQGFVSLGTLCTQTLADLRAAPDDKKPEAEHVRRMEYMVHICNCINACFAETSEPIRLEIIEMMQMVISDGMKGYPIKHIPNTLPGWENAERLCNVLMNGYFNVSADYRLHVDRGGDVLSLPFGGLITYTLDLYFMIEIGDYHALSIRVKRLLDFYMSAVVKNSK